jgi:hypothetical protein
MSMDLYVWKAPRVTETDDAQRLITSEDESVFEQSADLERFYAELLGVFPPPETFTEEELEDNPVPWADSPEGSDRLVGLSIRWSAKDEDLDTIVELARRYDLVLYDPQGPSFHSPPDENEDAASGPTIGEYVRGVLLAAFGVLLALLAWKASIPVLSWIVIFVGGFVTLVAVFLLGAISLQAWRVRAIRARWH